ncbi:hypothetical protein J3E71DRAFT_335437 [Bipolaris maydis]|nr:hypothetical protein J3E71DRAFT_335437 [Bipolaris maydis]
MTLLDLDEERSGGMLGRFASSVEPTASSTADRGIRAIAVHTQTTDDKGDLKHTFLLTAGPDWKIRYWDTSRADCSLIVSGLEVDEGKPQYVISQPSPDTVVVSERLQQTMTQNNNGRDGKGNASSKKGPGKPLRSGAIASQQQHLLKSHMDCILDVAFIEQPCGIIISADRSGVIHLYT